MKPNLHIQQWMKIIHIVVDYHPHNGYISTIFKRFLAPRIREALTDTPVIFINGARQCGKSTLAKQLVSKNYPAKYLTLDDMEVFNAARSDPSGFIAGLDSPVILDEIQHLPALFPVIKAVVDRDRTPGRFLLTGSTNISLIPELSKSLVGRIEIFNLWPFSQGEIDNHQETFLQNIFSDKFPQILMNKKNIDHLTTRIVRGGYPEVVLRTTEARKNAWFQSYITTILQRDIQELSRIEGLFDLPRLLKLIAARAATLLNFAELSRSIQFPQTTLKRYIALLEGVFLISLLPAWSNNLSKRLVKSPKIMLNDTSLLTFLLGYNETKLTQDPQVIGPILKNFVLNELRKQNSWNVEKMQFFHFRTQTGEEVDILIENAAGELVGIEVKNKTTLTETDFRGLRNFAELVKKRFRRGILLYNGDQIIPFGKNMHAIPLNGIWN
jgi:predicted AAA+ superfamily ATPase